MINMITLIRALCQKQQHYKGEENSSSANTATCLEAEDQHYHDDVHDDDGDNDVVNVNGGDAGDDHHFHLTLIQEVGSIVEACLSVDDCPGGTEDCDG